MSRQCLCVRVCIDVYEKTIFTDLLKPQAKPDAEDESTLHRNFSLDPSFNQDKQILQQFLLVETGIIVGNSN
jgi:hypothetical protein